ncbi:hypothetical protein CN563_20200 [Bacillus sp. AFS026049]|uniref:hypothetical protein n=1 Tax=Peribacillus frigoritolerans TaxID=450367 RepID=UPI000BF788AB|nr:hypothetical protein [Peribacillus frigoritolerans]MCR8869399.1 hypothetical protein [Peribacillus frigoritolerans]PEO44253.1 hypothetical protein CN563_20200 [Bacillus sp. AFS026049]
MNKSMIALIAAGTMLTACNNDKANENEEKSVQTTNENQTQTENEQQKQPSQTETQTSPEHGKWSSLPEYDKIIEQIGNEDYTFNKETDNDGKRVFLIELNGEKQYKTVFVKNTNRLKIIKINGGGEVCDRILQ